MPSTKATETAPHKKNMPPMMIGTDPVSARERNLFRTARPSSSGSMKSAVDAGLSTAGELPGGLHVERKAQYLYNQRHIDESAATRENRIVCAYAFAVAEQNADAGVIVTAPTCGSSGVVPAALKYMQEQKRFSDEQIVRALAVGGLIGNLIKTNASISGAECGCQAEIGSACSMTRGLSEIARLGLRYGAARETFAGLSGVGDLIVTCTSMHSRNRRAGILIGQGATAREAMDRVGAVVEGYYATESARQLGERAGIDLPIVAAAYDILYNNADPRTVVSGLMTREKRHDHIGAVPLEAGVGAHDDKHQQVAGGAAVGARVALTAHGHGLAVVDAGGDGHVELMLPAHIAHGTVRFSVFGTLALRVLI